MTAVGQGLYHLTVLSPRFVYEDQTGERREYFMFNCSDTIGGSPSFTIATEKQGDGTFKATCPSRPDLPPVSGLDEIEAIREMRRQLEIFVMTGGDGRADLIR